MKNKYKYEDLHYLCWIIERFGRVFDMPRKEVVESFGEKTLKMYLRSADAFHCENPDKIIGEQAEELKLEIPKEAQERINKPKPTVDDMAQTYARIVDELYPDDYIQGIQELFSSFLLPLLVRYQNNLYWANKEYLIACYLEGELL